MYKPPKNKKRAGQLTSVSHVLPQVGKELRLNERAQEWAVLSLWTRIIDEPFQATTRASRLRPKGGLYTLTVLVNSATVAAELSFFLEQYRQKLNEYRAETGLSVHRIEIRTVSRM
jgi:hypothetical protein